MPRRGNVPRNDILPDSVYNSKTVTKLINNIMIGGKKSVAQNIVYKAFGEVANTSGENPLEVFERALKNIMPSIEVKSRRVGGATYQVPIEVRPQRRETLGIRWLIFYASARSERTMIMRLAHEIMDAQKGTGGSVKKREDTHKMAEANKAFAHYRW